MWNEDSDVDFGAAGHLNIPEGLLLAAARLDESRQTPMWTNSYNHGLVTAVNKSFIKSHENECLEKYITS